MTILMDGVTGILGSAVGAELQGDVYYLVRKGIHNQRLTAGINKEVIAIIINYAVKYYF